MTALVHDALKRTTRAIELLAAIAAATERIAAALELLVELSADRRPRL